ncbi:MAG TPA: L-histidine N(alpha)-methyltransferase [Candidatus Acidoferrum sp.]|nr:L-histidine N(alpha)-methyltransferase [Candidatus Acidoferrum sp.]
MSGSRTLEPAACGQALDAERFRRDVLAGLAQPQKSLPCKYLYDEQGARLFEAICELPEYYPTRTETAILQRHIAEIAALIGPGANLVDLGSGNGQKTRLLLEHLERPAAYCPVDVAREQLVECSARLAWEHPGLEVQPVCADYTGPFELPPQPEGSGPTTVFFPGSTIGNFEPAQARVFLRRIAALSGPSGGLLVGVDLQKAADVLNPAYNDSQGVTAQFNLNLLARVNRELQARFDLARFRHLAFYNEAAGRIEMHLVSRGPQRIPVDGSTFSFARDETIVTEHSYKYTAGQFQQLAESAGFQVVRYWTDPRRWFSVHYLKPRPGARGDVPESCG